MYDCEQMNPSTYTPKKIVVCCDGTWNKPEVRLDRKRYRPTNVLRVARAVSPVDDHGHHQIIYYDSGVGTDGGIGYRMLGGATGYGLSSRIIKAYRFVCHNYVAGDELYFFGFSRGAYTVRALAGMIGAVGLLYSTDLHKLPTAFRYYNTHPQKRKNLPFYDEFIASHHTRQITIRFLGVWDTVGALGLPIPYIGPLTRRWVGFFNTEIGSHIEYGYHALAIDERRSPFKPNLWSKLEDNPDRPSCTKDVCQTWFPGSHSDVGGGAYNITLSSETLLWMVKRAIDCGLHFPPNFPKEIQKNINREASKPENSLSLFYKGLIPLGVFPRDRVIGNRPKITRLHFKTPSNSPLFRNIKERLFTESNLTVNEMIHESAFQKYVACEISEKGNCYQPNNLSPAINKLSVFREKYYCKRDQPRKRLHATGQVSRNDIYEDCRIIDFSPHGGAKLQMSDLQNRIGQTLKLEIHESEYFGTSHRGEVVWQNKFSLGLKFSAKVLGSCKIALMQTTMNQVVPWQQLEEVIYPYYKSTGGRPPHRMAQFESPDGRSPLDKAS